MSDPQPAQARPDLEAVRGVIVQTLTTLTDMCVRNGEVQTALSAWDTWHRVTGIELRPHSSLAIICAAMAVEAHDLVEAKLHELIDFADDNRRPDVLLVAAERIAGLNQAALALALADEAQAVAVRHGIPLLPSRDSRVLMAEVQREFAEHIIQAPQPAAAGLDKYDGRRDVAEGPSQWDS